jgi:hypothetical protein
MASTYYRLLGMRTFSGAATQDQAEYFDGGSYRVLEVQTRVTSGGSGGTIKLQHAAVNEDNAFIDVAGFTAVNLNAVTNNVQEITAFLRYLRWATGAAPTGNPTVLIDIVAKE